MTDTVWFSPIVNSDGKVVLTPVDVVELVAQYIEECTGGIGGIPGFMPDCYYGDHEFDKEKFKQSLRKWLETKEK
jgi:hypothetical protein